MDNKLIFKILRERLCEMCGFQNSETVNDIPIDTIKKRVLEDIESQQNDLQTFAKSFVKDEDIEFFTKIKSQFDLDSRAISGLFQVNHQSNDINMSQPRKVLLLFLIYSDKQKGNIDLFNSTKPKSVKDLFVDLYQDEFYRLVDYPTIIRQYNYFENLNPSRIVDQVFVEQLQTQAQLLNKCFSLTWSDIRSQKRLKSYDAWIRQLVHLARKYDIVTEDTYNLNGSLIAYDHFSGRDILAESLLKDRLSDLSRLLNYQNMGAKCDEMYSAYLHTRATINHGNYEVGKAGMIEQVRFIEKMDGDKKTLKVLGTLRCTACHSLNTKNMTELEQARKDLEFILKQLRTHHPNETVQLTYTQFHLGKCLFRLAQLKSEDSSTLATQAINCLVPALDYYPHPNHTIHQLTHFFLYKCYACLDNKSQAAEHLKQCFDFMNPRECTIKNCCHLDYPADITGIGY